MITRLKTVNFKALHNTDIRFCDFTVLIGNNASGKSSVIQAIDFLITSCKAEFSAFLEKIDLEASDILSLLSETISNKISFYSEWDIWQPEGTSLRLSWEMEIEVMETGDIHLIHELITDLDSKETLLSYDSSRKPHCLTVAEADGQERNYPSLTLTSSSLYLLLRDANDTTSLPKLTSFKNFLVNSYSYNVLSPEEMRQSNRGQVKFIGTSGRDLSAYIKGMAPETKKSILSKLRTLLGNTVTDIKTKTVNPGWSKVEAVELYGNNRITVSARNMSDGMLRLIAIVAISEYKAPSLILVDEIENGINTRHAEQLVKLLQNTCKKHHQQIIVSTHSTVFLDYFQPQNIVMFFRDCATGYTRSVTMSDIPNIQELCEYTFPGEIILNMSNQEIADAFLKTNAGAHID